MDMKPHAGHEGHSRRGTEAADAQTHHQHAHQAPEAPTSPPQLKDPVCGMTVTEQSQHRAEHDGRPYYFCSAKCLASSPPSQRNTFNRRRAQYLRLKRLPARSTPARCTRKSGKTTPALPQVRHDAGASSAELDEADNPELVDFKHRFWWTLPLTVVVTVMAMFGHRLGWFDMARQSWIELVLTLPIVLWAGAPFFVRGAQSIVTAAPTCGR